MFDSCGMLTLTFGVENFTKMIIRSCEKLKKCQKVARGSLEWREASKWCQQTRR